MLFLIDLIYGYVGAHYEVFSVKDPNQLNEEQFRIVYGHRNVMASIDIAIEMAGNTFMIYAFSRILIVQVQLNPVIFKTSYVL